jgi:predicted RecA/RadA family phage recombinase
MTSRPTTLALVLLFLLPSARAAASQEDAQGQLGEQEREAVVRSLPKGEPFRSGGQQYRLVGGLRAVHRGTDSTAREALARAGAAAAAVVEVKGRFVLFQQNASAAPLAAPQLANRVETLPVAVNERTGGLGVVLGTITVKLRASGQAEALAREHGLRLDLAAPHLSTAFYRVPAGASIEAATARLVNDARVVSAEIEVKEHFAEPK